MRVKKGSVYEFALSEIFSISDSAFYIALLRVLDNQDEVHLFAKKMFASFYNCTSSDKYNGTFEI
jgi:hypothetical protein